MLQSQHHFVEQAEERCWNHLPEAAEEAEPSMLRQAKQAEKRHLNHPGATLLAVKQAEERRWNHRAEPRRPA